MKKEEEKAYLIEPVALRKVRSQLEYRLKLKQNIFKKESSTVKKSGILQRFFRLF